MKNEIVTACYQLITAGINGTCQGVVLTLLVGGAMKLIGRTNAATRHAVWFGTLVLVAVLIPAHFLRERWDAFHGAVDAENMDSPAPEALPDAVSGLATDAIAIAPDAPVGSVHFRELAESTREQRAVVKGGFSDDQIARAEGRSSSSVLAALDEDVVKQARANEPQPELLSAWKERFNSAAKRLLAPVSWKIAAEIPPPLALGIPLLWLAIVGGKFSVLACQILRIRRLKRTSAAPSPEMNTHFISLRDNMRTRRDVMLKVSHEHKSAVVLGFLRPAILLPADLVPEQAENVLRHELAHINRRDDWANLVQQFIRTGFFFHPAICWMSKRISLEREIACDDQVLQSTRRPRAYALLLADLAERLQPSALAPGVSTNQNQLKQRIDMILNPNRNTSPRLARARLGLVASMAAAVAVAAIYSAPRVVLAQSVAAVPPAPPAPPAAIAAEEAAPAAPAVPADTASSASAGIGSAWAVAPTPSVVAGPKYKPGAVTLINPSTLAAPSIAPVASVPPIAPATPAPAPVIAVTPAPPALVIAGVDSSGPDQPGQAPRATRRGRDASLEERLDRLEKMVESLVAQQKSKPGQFDYHMKTPNEQGWTFDRKNDWANNFSFKWDQKQPDLEKRQAELEKRRAELEKSMADLEKLQPKDKAKIKELAEQQAKMARDAEAMARDAQRASRDAQRQSLNSARSGARQELEALRRQRGTLQKEMEKLDRQIEKMEREQDRSENGPDNEQQDQNDSRSEKPAQRSSSGNHHDTVSNANYCADSLENVQPSALPRMAADSRGF